MYTQAAVLGVCARGGSGWASAQAPGLTQQRWHAMRWAAKCMHHASKQGSCSRVKGTPQHAHAPGACAASASSE
eukprot:357803-Chlamydomonas_euryale.AAC.3